MYDKVIYMYDTWEQQKQIQSRQKVTERYLI